MSKIITSKPFLLIFYGYPGSGRTYFARQFSEEFQVANLQSDRIRSELFEKPRYDSQENSITRQLMDYMCEEFLAAGLSVIYDADILKNGQRAFLRTMANKYKAEFVICWLQVDEETSFARNIRRDKRKIDDKYSPKWDRTTFDKIIKQMQNPITNTEVVVISGKHLYQTQRNAVVAHFKRRAILNTNEMKNEIAKPGMVNLVPSVNAGRVNMSRRNIFIR